MPTTITTNNPIETIYSPLTPNSRVEFKAGTQADLNQIRTTGNAKEGAFYLTTDTHRLYIGRKSSETNKIIPEQVSRGVNIVQTTGQLPTAGSAEADEGELYYIVDQNILAALKANRTTNNEGKEVITGYAWVQINKQAASTALQRITENFSTSGTDVALTTVITTDDDSTTGKRDTITFKAGDNVSLSTDQNDTKSIIISSRNSQSYLKTRTTTNNEAPIILNNSDTEDTTVYLTGVGHTKVSSEVQVDEQEHEKYLLKIQGPDLTGASFSPVNAGGFKLSLTTENQPANTPVMATIDPKVAVGQRSSEVSFFNNVATLPVYTITETEERLQQAIENNLRAFDGLVYKGTISRADDIPGYQNASIGDVYKSISTTPITYNNDDQTSISIDTGDLIIAQTNYTPQVTYVQANKYEPDTTYYADNQGTALNIQPTSSSDFTTNTYYKQITEPLEVNGHIREDYLVWDLVPSGDEPVLTGYVAATDNAVSFGMQEEVGGGGQPTYPLKVTFNNQASNLITVRSNNPSGYSSDNFELKLMHGVPTIDENATNVTISSPTPSLITDANVSDTLQKNKITFQALSNIKKDAYGHILAIESESITLAHNYLTGLTSVPVSTNVHNGQINIFGTDQLSLMNSQTSIGNIKLSSDSLSFGTNTSTNELTIDLVWTNF